VIGDLRCMIPLFHPPKQATWAVEVGAETGEAIDEDGLSLHLGLWPDAAHGRTHSEVDISRRM
jgi:hypothetical protein